MKPQKRVMNFKLQVLFQKFCGFPFGFKTKNMMEWVLEDKFLLSNCVVLCSFSVCIIDLVRKNFSVSPLRLPWEGVVLGEARSCYMCWALTVLRWRIFIVVQQRDVSTLPILYSGKPPISGSRTHFGFWDKMRCDRSFTFNDGWKWHRKHFFT